MMTRNQVIIFARAPRLGNGKRRLAKDIGNRRSFQFYQNNLKRLIQELRNGPWQLHVAVTSQQEEHHPVFSQIPVVVQPNGDLGHRMATVLDQFRPYSRIIIGSDIPTLKRRHVQMAFKALSNHKVVVGPSPDGGFWCIGSSPLHAAGLHFMHGVRWSSPYALLDTLSTLKSSTKIAHIECLSDVDDGLSLARFHELNNS